ncbi:MAG: flagella basal body P-ring formation protein FlgA [Bradymonadales bacterium]|nr:MAG: flagella basal body P-ring formation protein FlgA [Bradymonadales bacterium]
MRKSFKIFIVLIAVIPMWLTLVAMAETPSTSEKWRSALNARLLEISDPRVQITELISGGELPDLKTLSENIQFDLTQINPRGISRIGVTVLDEKGRLKSRFSLRARVYAELQVPVSLRPLRAGEIVQREDIEMRWMDAVQVGSSPINPNQLFGAQIRSFIPAESVIQVAQVQPPQLVRRGERVKVMVVSDGLSVSTIGIAQEAGVLGQNIRILNPDSRREMFATVTGSQMAEVRI